jgi:glycosyltransferase involved in cell wall biosynthesis
MRFAIVGPAYPYRGGISQYTVSLCRSLEKEHQVLLVTFSRLYPQFLFPGRCQTDLGAGAFKASAERLLDSIRPGSWKRTASRILEFQPDAVLFQWWHYFFGPAYSGVLRRLKRDGRFPAFFLCHNVHPHERLRAPGSGILEKSLLEGAFKQVDGFLVHSRQLGDQVLRIKPSAPVRHIYHPMFDFYGDFESETENRSREEVRIPQLLFFGNVRCYKGLRVLLEALGKVGPRLDFALTVAGEFYVDPEPYYELAKRQGIAGKITWINRYVPNEQVPALFRKADVIVLPYLEATQSGIVPLAYQFEVPVIASRVGGLPEVVQEGETGFLVPAGSADLLAEKIIEYFSNGRKWDFQKKIRCFREKLSWQQVVDGLVDLTAEAREKRTVPADQAG